jgi:hypothetical protein
MKFLVQSYSYLQNPWLGCHRPQISVLSVLNRICWTPPNDQNSWVRHWFNPIFNVAQISIMIIPNDCGDILIENFVSSKLLLVAKYLSVAISPRFGQIASLKRVFFFWM